MHEKPNEYKLPAVELGISAGIAVVDTAIICAISGFSIPVLGIIGIGAGIFGVTFSAFACCQAASRTDESLGYK